VTVALIQPRFDHRGNSNYRPCEVGLHLCGSALGPGDRDEQPYTALNLPARDHAEARRMFDAARTAAECTKDEADFICDLNLGSRQVGVEHVDDFFTNRQLVDRLVAATLPPKQGGGK
jgi:hypothetical protein